jgi:RNase adaptor protein for sRNA GlmZ degradation
MTSILYFITGSSGIGKSTIIPTLKSNLTDVFDIHDFDEQLTEEIAMSGNLLDVWRKETTAYWIEEAVKNQKNEKSTIIVGLIYPNETTTINTDISISFCLLDASDEKIRERLMGKRFSTSERIAGLKQATGQTPEEFIEENKNTMDRLRQEVKKVNGFVIDTTNDTPDETAAKIVSWIKS